MGTPVFVGGINRSGTTLMARILGSNSALAVPPSEFLFFGRGAASEPADRAEFERRLAEILTWPRVREWGLDERDVLERSRTLPATARSLFLLPLEAYRGLAGKSRVGEKSVLNEFRVDAFEAWFGDYRLVHMIREPIATYASGHRSKPRSVRQAIRWGRVWAASAAIGLRRARSDPGRHKLVRYEELAAQPRATIAAVCEFAGLEPEEEAMLGLAAYEQKENSTFGAAATGSYEGAIRQSDAVDRHAAVHARERAALARICGAAASALGYALEGRRSLVVEASLAAEWARPRQRLLSLVGARVK
jgi:sulfotransferase family protein